MLHSELTKLYIGRGVQKSIYKFTRQLSNLSYEADLEEVANKMDLELQTSEFFTKDTKKYDVKFVASAYSAGVLNKDENSDLIELSKDKFMVLRINKKIAQRQKIFNEVESEIYKYLSTLLTKTFIDNITSKITTSLNDGNTDIAQKLIDKYQLKWKNVGWVKRDSKQENIGIINSVFALPKPNNSTTYGRKNVNEQQSVVLKLLAIKVPRSTSDSMLSSVILGFESEELLSRILKTLHKEPTLKYS